MVTAGGTWGITPGTPLGIGLHTLTSTETEIAGNVSVASGPLALTIETSTPAPDNLTLATASDSGTSHSDRITNITIPVITGTGANGDVVTLFEGTTSLGSALVTAGAWSITSASLADGQHTLTATETDAANNISPVSVTPLVVTIETSTTAPDGLTLYPDSDSGTKLDDITNVTIPVITGTGANGDVVTLYEGSTSLGSALVTAGAWSITSSTLTPGAHTLTATETDAAGNSSAVSRALTVNIENTLPLPTSTPVLDSHSDTGISDSDGITSVTQPAHHRHRCRRRRGQAVRHATSVLVGTATVTAGGTWGITPATPLAAGTYSLTSTETDIAGNISPVSAAFALIIETSTTAPTGLVLAPGSDTGAAGDDITDNTTPFINGSGATGDVVTLYDAVAGIVGSGAVTGGAWSIMTSALAPGSHTLTATETDAAGNTSAVSTALGLTIDTNIPATTSIPVLDADSDSGSSNSDNITRVATPLITGTGVSGDVVRLYDATSTLLGSSTVTNLGTWAITSAHLADGVHTLTSTETSTAGDVSLASGALSLTIDTAIQVPPAGLTLASTSDSGFSSSDDITNITTPVITGTGVTGDVVTLHDGLGGSIGSATVANGAWTIMTTALGDGPHTLIANETDVAGNLSLASATPLVVTIDTVAPAAPSGLSLFVTDDSGAHGDGITNVTTPRIDGNGIFGDLVTLYDAGTAVGSATVDGPGHWSVTSTALLAGVFSLTATQTDVAGNVSAASAPFALTVETLAPPPAGLTLAATSDSGISDSDDITNFTTPVITGTGVTGDVVTLHRRHQQSRQRDRGGRRLVDHQHWR